MLVKFRQLHNTKIFVKTNDLAIYKHKKRKYLSTIFTKNKNTFLINSFFEPLELFKLQQKYMTQFGHLIPRVQ